MDGRHFRHLKPGRLRSAGDLLAAYARRPQNIVRHLRNLAKRPIDNGLPMLTFGAIDYLNAHLRPEMSVFEFGCGGSTIYFAERCRVVTTVENRPNWYGQVAGATGSHHNVTILLKPQIEHPAELVQPYDVILVDGEADRRTCFARAEKFIRNGGMIILDDAWWPLGISSRQAKAVLQFLDLGPYRYVPSCTDIFTY